ncbi:MAG: alpha/beta hydrolase [Myxococcota bacterium]|nr:alpha/beta hydrolase [Myxococcota bacterium]
MATNETPWHAFLSEFDLEPEALRPGCEPSLHEHDEPVRNGIVLTHGLTDSPHFMRAIAERFHRAGWNTYLPLLHMHGLRDPRDMSGVSLATWKANVDFAIEAATKRCERVSVGGLSTGGALSAHAALDAHRVTGGVFLFSACFDIHGRLLSRATQELRREALGKWIELLERWIGGRGLVGDNPYRYARITLGSARQLGMLISELDERIQAAEAEAARVLDQPVFASHSEYDFTADIRAVDQLYALCDPERRGFFRVRQDDALPEGHEARVGHASLVLRDAIEVEASEGSLEQSERPNPFFEEMMDQALDFAERHLR